MEAGTLEGLNDAQRAAAEAVRGPVCILAGAGSGKTTTITRRIAHQVATGTFAPRELLAITFTDRAANEMRTRLRRLGVHDVGARTFHAEALKQVAFFREAPKLLSSKAQIVSPLVRRLPRPYRFRPTKDVAGEIEWAKNRRITPERYADELPSGRQTALPADLMTRVYREYEERKRSAGMADFEDLLDMALHLMTKDAVVAERVRARYRAFTVDEYQDVNLLQQSLLDAWLGGRDEVCVVGDDYQSIYGFTGASPRWLLGFQQRYAAATVVALEASYRSTPQVLDVANRLVPRLGGSRKTLRATVPDGAEPRFAEHITGAEETDAVVAEVRRLHDTEAVPYEEIAVLYRINARSEDYEEAFADAGIPYQVRDGSFLRRPGPREVVRRLSRAVPSAPAGEATEHIARDVGWDLDGEPQGSEEATRQADLTRLVRLATDATTVEAFLADLQARFSPNESGRGVVLSTYHRAKGLEWDAVILPRLEERELPFALSKTDEDIAEERRLLYVGITRARRYLYLSWVCTRDGKAVRRSRFLSELLPAASKSAPRPKPAVASVTDPDLFARLRAWRKEAAEEQGVPAYVVFHDATLREICERKPSSLSELGLISGIGPTKLGRYGGDVLAVVGDDGG